jgi:diacylglycerol kinase (ATP)
MKKTGLARILAAFGYSKEGLADTFRTEAAFRQELALCAFGLPLALWAAPGRASAALMVASLFLILIVEVVNSAIEAAINRHGPALHPESKKAKDAGTAAVFLAFLNAAAVWLICLLP